MCFFCSMSRHFAAIFLGAPISISLVISAVFLPTFPHPSGPWILFQFQVLLLFAFSSLNQRRFIYYFWHSQFPSCFWFFEFLARLKKIFLDWPKQKARQNADFRLGRCKLRWHDFLLFFRFSRFLKLNYRRLYYIFLAYIFGVRFFSVYSFFLEFSNLFWLENNLQISNLSVNIFHIVSPFWF